MNSLILCTLPILFSIVKFKLGYNFFQFIHRCKIFECWFVTFIYFLYFLRLYFQVVPNSQRGFGIFKCCFSRTSQFFPIHDKVRKLGFLKTNRDCIFYIFLNSLKCWEIWISEVPSYIFLLSLKLSSYSEKMRWG